MIKRFNRSNFHKFFFESKIRFRKFSQLITMAPNRLFIFEETFTRIQSSESFVKAGILRSFESQNDIPN